MSTELTSLTSCKLTFCEGVKLRDTLRDAFRSQIALNQVVFEQFGQKLSQISKDDSYRGVITDLILWAENNGKTAELIIGARKLNPGHSLLLNFESLYTSRYHNDFNIPSLPQPVLTPELRTKLVDVLLKIPTANDYAGRSDLLIGISGSSNLNRNPENAISDFNRILDQLDSLGRLNSGRWPLLLLIDSALEFVKDFQQPVVVLKWVRNVLVEKYGGE